MNVFVNDGRAGDAIRFRDLCQNNNGNKSIII